MSVADITQHSTVMSVDCHHGRIALMTRWEPNARGRLQRAALELYSERGYDQTTVAEIAKRAGLTERTFFRYFADKREVLFHGSGAAPGADRRGDRARPGRAVADRRRAARRSRPPPRSSRRPRLPGRRQAIIAANPELQERELIKLAALAAALADALRGRGVADPAASLAAEAGIAVFKVAFQRWVSGAGGPVPGPGDQAVHCRAEDRDGVALAGDDVEGSASPSRCLILRKSTAVISPCTSGGWAGDRSDGSSAGCGQRTRSARTGQGSGSAPSR